MEWQQVIGFYHVARTGSFTKAADMTFRTQSALSQQVKSLEAEFGCLLFERIGKRKLRLTLAGEKLLTFAEDLLERHRSLREEMAGLTGSHAGRLRISAPFTTLYHLLPQPLKVYAEAFPQVRLSLLDCPQRKVLELVRSGEVDFGLVLESAVPTDMEALRWEQVRTVLIVPHGHPLAKKKRRIDLHEIAEYPLILPPEAPEHTRRSKLEQICRAEGIVFHVMMESSNVELSSLYVELGLGLCFAMVGSHRASTLRSTLTFIPMDHYFDPEHVAIVMRKTTVMTPIKKAFLNMLLDESESCWDKSWH